MIKLIICLKRAPGMTRSDMQAYWREEHAELVLRHADTLGIRRYVQSHRLTSAQPGDADGYDGVVEVWFDSVEAVERAARTGEGRQALAEIRVDERRFFQPDASPRFYVTEHVVQEG